MKMRATVNQNISKSKIHMTSVRVTLSKFSIVPSRTLLTTKPAKGKRKKNEEEETSGKLNPRTMEKQKLRLQGFIVT